MNGTIAQRKTRAGRAAKTERSMPRNRDKQPNKKTLEGQAALYLAWLMEAKGVTAKKLSDETGIHRATIFRWLRGDSSPSLADLTPLAKALGLKDGWALKPPPSFLETL